VQFLLDQNESIVKDATLFCVEIVSFRPGLQPFQYIIEAGQRQMRVLGEHALAVSVQFLGEARDLL